MPFIPDETQSTGFIPDPPERSTMNKLGSGLKSEFSGEKAVEKIPIFGGVAGAVSALETISAAKRLSSDYDYDARDTRSDFSGLAVAGAPSPSALQAGSVPKPKLSREKDEETVAKYLEQLAAEAELGGAGKVAKGLADAPTFMAEFALTGGLAKLGSGAAKLAAKKALKRYANTIAGRASMRAAGWTAGAITRATIGLSPRVGETVANRRLEVELGARDESPITSLIKGWGSVTIEAASETAGGSKFIPRLLRNKTRLGKVLVPKLQQAWTTVTGGTAGEFARNMTRKAGLNNILSEIGEERLSTIMSAITNVEDFGAGSDANMLERLQAGIISDVENFGYELAVLGPIGGGQVALGTTMNVLSNTKQGTDLGKPVEDAIKVDKSKVPDYIAKPSLTRSYPGKESEVQTEIIKPATVIRGEKPIETTNDLMSNLVDDYMNHGMTKEQAITWAQRTMDSGTPVGRIGEGNAAEVVFYEPEKRRLIKIPGTKAIPEPITDKSVAEALADRYGVSGQEAMEMIEQTRTGATPSRDVPTKLQNTAIHGLSDALGMTNVQLRSFMQERTGKKATAQLTQDEAQIVVNDLQTLVDEKGKSQFKMAGTRFTPSIFRSRLMGTHFLVKPLIEGKLKHVNEYQAISRQVDKMHRVINTLGKETTSSKLKAKLNDKPTESVRQFYSLLDTHEEAPSSLSKEERDVFNFFRTLSGNLLDAENNARRELGMEPIPHRKAYVRHMITQEAREIMNGVKPIPKEVQARIKDKVSKKVFNPMELQRTIEDELDLYFQQDLIKATKAMAWTALKEIHLNKPLQFFEQRLTEYVDDMPVTVRKWTEDFVKEAILGRQTIVDERLDQWAKDQPLGKLIDKVMRKFGKTMGDRPATTLLTKASRLQLHGVMGWRPKQLIRNKFQILQNLMIYKPSSILKSYTRTNDPMLNRLMEESEFLKSYGGMELLDKESLTKLGNLNLAPFQITAVTNAKRSMRVAYEDTLDLITNPKFKDYGWADPQRTYKEPKGFLYESERQALLEEMEFGAGVTQYHYIPMAMPEVFRSKTNAPLTRLQSWWMNYWFKFMNEGARRAFTGKTLTGRKVPPSRRLGMMRYLVAGGTIMNGLGYSSSFLFGTAPGLSPMVSMVLGLFEMTKAGAAGDDQRYGQGKYKFVQGLKTFIPGYLTVKDAYALLNGEKDLKEFLSYSKHEEPSPRQSDNRRRKR